MSIPEWQDEDGFYPTCIFFHKAKCGCVKCEKKSFITDEEVGEYVECPCGCDDYSEKKEE